MGLGRLAILQAKAGKSSQRKAKVAILQKKRLFKFGGEIAGSGTSVSSLLKVIKGYSRLLKPKNKKKYF
jgi:hypothetical protein